jgi:hypothetical protein
MVLWTFATDILVGLGTYSHHRLPVWTIGQRSSNSTLSKT